MKLGSLRDTAALYYKNLRGWRTDRKIVVIESDDWGSIRTSSNKALSELRSMGVQVDKCHYMLNDALASETDLRVLFDLLASHKDMNGNNPVFTANVIMANPNFDKIINSEYADYNWEPFDKTLKRYSEHENSFNLWQKGIANKLFYPQLHGREHVNISRWLEALRSNDESLIIAFKHNMFGVSRTVENTQRGSLLAALDGNNKIINSEKEQIISDAVKVFKSTFGFKPLTFIAPNYVWDSYVENALHKNEVKFIQGSGIKRISRNFKDPLKVERQYLGQKNTNGQRYLLRNVLFEPSELPSKDWVSSAMLEIEVAFRLKKPATISSHRVNYIGFLNKRNRENGLRQLDLLLKSMLLKWPELEFMTSQQLAETMQEEEKN